MSDLLAEMEALPAAEWTAYRLAREGEIASPDSTTSPGAVWLNSVRDAALELREEIREDGTADVDDRVHQLSEAAVEVYTYPLWQIFVDLCLFSEPVPSWTDTVDMTMLANYITQDVAERLIRRILQHSGVGVYA